MFAWADRTWARAPPSSPPLSRHRRTCPSLQGQYGRAQQPRKGGMGASRRARASSYCAVRGLARFANRNASTPKPSAPWDAWLAPLTLLLGAGVLGLGHDVDAVVDCGCGGGWGGGVGGSWRDGQTRSEQRQRVPGRRCAWCRARRQRSPGLRSRGKGNKRLPGGGCRIPSARALSCSSRPLTVLLLLVDGQGVPVPLEVGVTG